MAKKLQEKKKAESQEEQVIRQAFSPKMVGFLADEVAKTVIRRLPQFRRSKRRVKKAQKIENAIFLDTSAIIDGRIFDIVKMGLFSGTFVVIESILLELKHIADSQDTVKRERGRKGLELLEKMKKIRGIKFKVIEEEREGKIKDIKEVDEKLTFMAKLNKGKIITCDYNLEKKANISNITAVNINTLATFLKVRAVPGEALHIRILHKGKEPTQGVGYLDDGTMIVVEAGAQDVGRELDVLVSRVIQTTAGRILFSRKLKE
ncbi:MAG: PIN domain-containing protein [Patescibacteria group bacterium]